MEIMDLEEPALDEMLAAYKLMRHVNRFLGGRKVIIDHLEAYHRRWPDKPITILDVGCGSADIPLAVARWARSRQLRVIIIALDLNHHLLENGRANMPDYPEIQWLCASSHNLPFKNTSVDYVTTSMFFHHLSEVDIIRALNHFDRISRRGMVVNDLLRYTRAYLWIRFFCLFTRNRIFRYDAPLSVLRGFVQHEVESISARAGLGYLQFRKHFGHRFALAGEK